MGSREPGNRNDLFLFSISAECGFETSTQRGPTRGKTRQHVRPKRTSTPTCCAYYQKSQHDNSDGAGLLTLHPSYPMNEFRLFRGIYWGIFTPTRLKGHTFHRRPLYIIATDIPIIFVVLCITSGLLRLFQDLACPVRNAFEDATLDSSFQILPD